MAEWIDKGIRSDVLLLIGDKYYEPYYMTLDRIIAEFSRDQTCFVEPNLVILHEITSENIFRSVEKLHRTGNYQFWIPSTQEDIAKRYSPKGKWRTLSFSFPKKE